MVIRHYRRRGHWALASLLVGVTLAASGCASSGAMAEPEAPPLLVPEAPPRLVSEFPPETPEPDPVPAEREVVAVPAPPPETQTATVDTAPPPADPEPEPAEPAASPAPLELTSPPGVSIDTETVRSSLTGTAGRLRTLDRASLSPAGRAQYDTARRFLDQARAALAVDNVTFAHYLGQKADTLVRGLIP